jgi:hypothetical protein
LQRTNLGELASIATGRRTVGGAPSLSPPRCRRHLFVQRVLLSGRIVKVGANLVVVAAAVVVVVVVEAAAAVVVVVRTARLDDVVARVRLVKVRADLVVEIHR